MLCSFLLESVLKASVGDKFNVVLESCAFAPPHTSYKHVVALMVSSKSRCTKCTQKHEFTFNECGTEETFLLSYTCHTNCLPRCYFTDSEHRRVPLIDVHDVSRMTSIEIQAVVLISNEAGVVYSDLRNKQVSLKEQMRQEVCGRETKMEKEIVRKEFKSRLCTLGEQKRRHWVETIRRGDWLLYQKNSSTFWNRFFGKLKELGLAYDWTIHDAIHEFDYDKMFAEDPRRVGNLNV